MSKHIIDGLTVTGQVGQVVTLLNRVLTIAQATHEASGPTFTDRTTEARTEGGTAYTLLGATTDRFYFGYDAKFPGIRVDLDVAGAGLALVWEYWNGSTWAALSGVAGAASGLTADGAVTWTIPGSWAKTTVDSGASLYFVRARTTTHTTSPTAFFTVVNWTLYDDLAGTNAKVYKSIGEDGASAIYVHVDDNAPTSADRCHFRVYESWDSGAHTGTAACPTVGQQAVGSTWHKSATADATARSTTVFVSRDKLILFVAYNNTGAATGTANPMSSVYVGKFLSYVAGDAFNLIAAGGNTLSSSAERFAVTNATNSATAALVGHFVQRAYTGSGGSILAGAFGLIAAASSAATFFSYPNGPNGGITMHPKMVSDPISGVSAGHIRGVLSDVMLLPLLGAATLINGDTYTDPATSKVYWVIKSDVGNSLGAAPWCAIEAPA